MSTVAQQGVEHRVKKEVADQLGLSISDARNEAHIVHDLGADSLDAVELVMAIEDEFGIEIADEVMWSLTTVQSVIDCVTAEVAR